MIFLTIGTQLGFDRLVEYVDKVAGDIDEPVFGQIGNGNYEPANFKFQKLVNPPEFDGYMRSARVVISHAGIGTILNARKYEKPLIITPRLASRGEHRNDHQLATTKELGGRRGIYVAYDEKDIMRYVTTQQLDGPEIRAEEATQHQSLVDALKRHISG